MFMKMRGNGTIDPCDSGQDGFSSSKRIIVFQHFRSQLWEEFQSIKADPIKKCPSCGKSKARRQIGGGAGLIFKGSGFYLTDYRSDSYKKAAEADKKASSGGDSAPKSDGGSAPKPESGKKNSDKS